MKLKEHIQLINYNNKAILVNTYNKSIVTINSDRICNKEILKDKFKEEEIEYLSKSGFLAEKTDKDYELIIPDRKRTTIVINITENCNIKCKYCYQSNIHPEPRSIGKGTIELILDYIYDLMKVGKKDFYIYFFGGEPLLYKDKIIDIKNKIDCICRQNDSKVRYGIGSNCIKLTEDFLSNFDSLDVDATLTTKCDHNYMRSSKVHKDTFAIIFDNLLNAYKNHNFNLHITYNVHDGNINKFEEFLKILRSNNLDNIKISVSYIDNYAYNNDFYNRLDYKDYIKWKSSYAIELLIKYGFFVYGSPFSNIKFSCDAYNDGSIKFFSDGKIGACHYTKYCDRLDIDHLDYESVVNAKNNLTKKEELISNNRKCKNCDNIYLCPGKIYCTDNNCPKNSDYDLDLYIKTFINAKKDGKSYLFKDMEGNL